MEAKKKSKSRVDFPDQFLSRKRREKKEQVQAALLVLRFTYENKLSFQHLVEKTPAKKCLSASICISSTLVGIYNDIPRWKCICKEMELNSS